MRVPGPIRGVSGISPGGLLVRMNSAKIASAILNLRAPIARLDSSDERYTRTRLDQEDTTQRFYTSVWPHRASVLRLARILTANEADADDLAQETFIKAFKALDRFVEGTDMMAWLATILRHARIDRLRSQAASATNISLDQMQMDPAGEGEKSEDWDNPQEVLNAFGDQEIITALQALPEEIRWTLLLVDVQQMEQRDAAHVMDIPVGTVKSRVHRGRAMLRRALTPLARERRLLNREGEELNRARP